MSGSCVRTSLTYREAWMMSTIRRLASRLTTSPSHLPTQPGYTTSITDGRYWSRVLMSVGVRWPADPER
ncbi:hypothetical protein Pcinc_042919 [Petrolisthes cinctipes]|uniref:Uncharacterized protein n=1 Tax=Petrolisthes cinctipes TaxID=88211 RepID=A0AAE1BGJ2_PETCI|nr:hypothetical protein Pcinc_042919 [Petrolisthes cinctipes]KAK3850371.1 hypothetical protein Pcinc_042919 [Petrolisthes cinctipes]KAK3850372.1 hypothetical protein Pcinc_042919 [Petrolisthes cinctipes]